MSITVYSRWLPGPDLGYPANAPTNRGLHPGLYCRERDQPVVVYPICGPLPNLIGSPSARDNVWDTYDNSCLHCNHLFCFHTQTVWLSHCYVHKRYELLSFLSRVLSFGLQYAGKKKLSLAITGQDLVTHEPDSVFMFEIWEEQYVQANLGWILLGICCDHVAIEAPAVIVKLIHSCRRITLATCIRI